MLFCRDPCVLSHSKFHTLQLVGWCHDLEQRQQQGDVLGYYIGLNWGLNLWASNRRFLLDEFFFPNTDHVTIPKKVEPLSCSCMQAWKCPTFKEVTLWSIIMWSVLGKQNQQAIRVYYSLVLIHYSTTMMIHYWGKEVAFNNKI